MAARDDDVLTGLSGTRQRASRARLARWPRSAVRCAATTDRSWAPSPADGLWRSAVTLEQRVTDGDLLGTIIDPLGQEIARITSPAAGMVLYYLSALSVRKGDPLMHVAGVGDG